MAISNQNLTGQSNSQFINVTTSYVLLHTAAANESVAIYVNNGASTSVDVTFKVDTSSGGTAKEAVVTIPAKSTRMLAQLDLQNTRNVYAKTSSGTVAAWGDVRGF